MWLRLGSEQRRENIRFRTVYKTKTTCQETCHDRVSSHFAQWPAYISKRLFESNWNCAEASNMITWPHQDHRDKIRDRVPWRLPGFVAVRHKVAHASHSSLRRGQVAIFSFDKQKKSTKMCAKNMYLSLLRSNCSLFCGFKASTGPTSEMKSVQSQFQLHFINHIDLDKILTECLQCPPLLRQPFLSPSLSICTNYEANLT